MAEARHLAALVSGAGDTLTELIAELDLLAAVMEEDTDVHGR